MNVIKEIQRINERELELGISDTASWHYAYRHSAYIFIGGLDFDLSEGDILAVFSQFGEIVDLNLVRDKTSGRSRGFAFLAYEDQRSTVVAIDNMNGYKLLGRYLRVDHADRYRRPKEQKVGDKSGGGEDEYKVFGSPEEDADYDTRRKRIWDYEKYGVLDTGRKVARKVEEIPQVNFTRDGALIVEAADTTTGATAPTSGVTVGESAEDSRHAQRVMQMLKEKQRLRELQRRQEMESGDAKGASSRTGTAVGVDGQTRFGDQVVAAVPAAPPSPSSSAPAPATAAAASSSSSSSSRRADRHRSRSRSRSTSRSRSHRSSRSRRRSHSRDRSRSRSRSRSRDRRHADGREHRDKDRDGGRSRSRERRREHRNRSRSRDRRR